MFNIWVVLSPIIQPHATCSIKTNLAAHMKAEKSVKIALYIYIHTNIKCMAGLQERKP
jgi:hypothetical protein